MFENKFNTPTPIMINKIPMIAAQSGVCLNAIMPTSVTSTIPNADQIA